MVFTICVEGNIGSGKSTFLKEFSATEKNSFHVCVEPVEKWRNLSGHNVLDLMYSDPDRWSYLFQSYVQLTMTQLHLKSVSEPVKMLERSLLSAESCFVENLLLSRRMKECEYAVIKEWYSYLHRKMDLKVDLIIYLRTSPSIAHQRLKSRNRGEETQIPLQYLQDLHKLHEKWIAKVEKEGKIPVLILNADSDLDMTHPHLYKDYANKITRFLHSKNILCNENKENEKSSSPIKSKQPEVVKSPTTKSPLKVIQ